MRIIQNCQLISLDFFCSSASCECHKIEVVSVFKVLDRNSSSLLSNRVLLQNVEKSRIGDPFQVVQNDDVRPDEPSLRRNFLGNVEQQFNVETLCNKMMSEQMEPLPGEVSRGV